MTPNEIKLKLTIDSKEALVSIKLTDDNIKKLYKSFKYGKQEVRGFTTQMSMGFNNAREILGGLRETYQAITALFQKPIQAFVDFKQASISFGVLLNDGEKAKQLIQDLRDFGAKTPLQFPGLIKATQTMLAFGIESERIMPTLKQLGDISLGDANRLKSLTLAFSQSQAAGKLMGQDLLQMINVGFNPLQTISKKTGKSLSELRDEMGKGAISSKDVADAFQMATSKGGKFYGMLGKMSESLGGKLSNFKDNIALLQTTIGGTLGYGLSPLIEHINGVTSSLNKNHPELVGFIGATATLGGAIGILNTTGIMPMIFKLDVLKASMVSTRYQFNLMKTAGYTTAGGFRAAGMAVKGFWASLGPVGVAVLGLTALVEIIALFGDETDDLAGSMSHNEVELRLQQKEFKQLTDKINDGNLALSDRKEALSELQKKYPGYLTNIDLEKISQKELTELIKKGNDEYERRIRIKVYEEKHTEALKKQIKLEGDLEKRLKEGSSFWNNFMDGVSGKPLGSFNAEILELQNNISKASDEASNWQGKMEGTKKSAGNFFAPEDLENLKKERDIINESIVKQIDNLVTAKETLRKIETGALKPKEGTALNAIKKQRAEVEFINNSINSSKQYQLKLDKQIVIQEKLKKTSAEAIVTFQDEIKRLRSEEIRLATEYGELPFEEKAIAKVEYEKKINEIISKRLAIQLNLNKAKKASSGNGKGGKDDENQVDEKSKIFTIQKKINELEKEAQELIKETLGLKYEGSEKRRAELENEVMTLLAEKDKLEFVTLPYFVMQKLRMGHGAMGGSAEVDELFAEIDKKIKEAEANTNNVKTLEKRIEAERELAKLIAERKALESKIEAGIKGKEYAKDFEELQDMELGVYENRFAREDAMLDLQHKRDLARYEGVADAKRIIDDQYDRDKRALDSARINAEVGATVNALNFVGGVVAEHTVAGKAIAVASATWKTYQAANNALSEIPPPYNFVVAAAVVGAGLANVAKITGITPETPKEQQIPGFKYGGRFREGEAGYIEGYHNEIIAPEKTFLEVFERELKPQIYSNIVATNISNGSANGNTLLISKINDMNTNLLKYLQNPVPPIIGKNAVGKMWRDGRKMSKGYRQ